MDYPSAGRERLYWFKTIGCYSLYWNGTAYRKTTIKYYSYKNAQFKYENTWGYVLELKFMIKDGCNMRVEIIIS